MATSTYSTTQLLAALTEIINSTWGTPARSDVCALVEAIIDLITSGVL